MRRTIIGIFGLIWKLYTAMIFSVTALIFYLLIFPFLFSERGKKRSFRLFVAWSWIVRILCLFFVKKVKNSPLPKGPYMIIANHLSYLDIFLMYSILPSHPFLFMGKSELLRYPLIKTYFKRLNVPVDRKNRAKAAKSVLQAEEEMKKGWSFMIFPEGKIPDENPRMSRFKSGAFQLSKSVNVPIVPMTFTTNHLLFSDPSFILGPAGPGVSRVYIHDFISAAEVQETDQEELIQRCHNIVYQPLLEEYPELKNEKVT